jgi:hypothetical protein
VDWASLPVRLSKLIAQTRTLLVNARGTADNTLREPSVRIAVAIWWPKKLADRSWQGKPLIALALPTGVEPVFSD